MSSCKTRLAMLLVVLLFFRKALPINLYRAVGVRVDRDIRVQIRSKYKILRITNPKLPNRLPNFLTNRILIETNRELFIPRTLFHRVPPNDLALILYWKTQKNLWERTIDVSAPRIAAVHGSRGTATCNGDQWQSQSRTSLKVFSAMSNSSSGQRVCLRLNMCMISKTLPRFHRYQLVIMMSPLFLFVTETAPVFCSESCECSKQIDGLVSIKSFLPYWWGDPLKNFLLFYDWNDNDRPMSLYMEQPTKKISTHSTKWWQNVLN
jgi:hypothetical protein